MRDADELIERINPPRAPDLGAPPLLVLLHGIGADEHDLLPLASYLDGRFYTVSLRGPERYVVGHAWFQIEWQRDGTVVPDVAGAGRALARLRRWLAAAPERHGTDPRRTFLLGFSQGAMMSLGVLVTAPELLAGVVALSGRFAEGLFQTTADPEAIARVPVLAAHGTRDDVLPVEHGRQARAALEGRLRDFTYREFPIGHEVGEAELALVATWLAARL